MVDLKEVTFTIPTRIDSEDRKNNLIIVIDYLLSKFNTNIIVCEEDSESKCLPFWKDEWRENGCVLMFRENKKDIIFHKTKNLNAMARAAKTPIIASLDSDVLFPSEQYVKARDAIMSGQYDCVYPFNRPTLNIPKQYHSKIVEAQSVLGFEKYIKPGHPGIAPGGCLFMRRGAFFKCGLENEYFVGWGPEDRERTIRLERLGARFTNVLGFLYHLEHVRTMSSRIEHQYTKNNHLEYKKIYAMGRDELSEYVKTWPWVHE